MNEDEYRWPVRQHKNVYRDEIINSCAKVVEDAVGNLRYGHVNTRASYYALMDAAKSIRALAK